MNLIVALGLLYISFTNAPGNPRDFSALYKSGADNTQYLSWQYLCGNQTCRASKVTKGSLSFQLPKIDGDYEIRFLSVTPANTVGIMPNSPTIKLQIENGIPK